MKLIWSQSEVSVVWASLDLPNVETKALAAVLSDGEVEVADRLVSPVHRSHFIARRGLLRRHLGKMVGQDPKALRFHVGPSGKPYLDRYPLWFSSSTSRGQMVVATSESTEVGIDLEWIDLKIEMEGLLDLHFTSVEADFIQGLAAEARTPRFFQTWCRKEACAKALGWGITHSVREFDLAFPPLGTQWAQGDPRFRTVLAGLDINTDPSYACAVALSQPLV